MAEFKYQQVMQAVWRDYGCRGAVGDWLPPAPELCRQYQISMITLKHALRQLAAAGVLRRIPGKGTCLTGKTPRNNAPPPLRVLCIGGWSFARNIRWLANRFQRFEPSCRFQFDEVGEIDYARQMQQEEYDLLLLNIWGIREILTRPKLRSRILPLEQLPGLLFDADRIFGNLQRHCRHGRHNYVLPLLVSPSVALINLEYPGMPRNAIPEKPDQEEFFHFFRQLKRTGPPGRRPFLFNAVPNRWLHFLKVQGCPIFSTDGRQCVIDTPEGIAGCQTLRELLGEDGIAQLGPDTDGLHLFRHGGFASCWATYQSRHTRYRPAIRYTRLPHAQHPGGQLLIEGIAIGRSCERPELLARFCNYLQQAESLDFLNRCGNGFAATRLLGETQVLRDTRTNRSFEVILQALAEAEPLVQAPQFHVIWRLWELLQPTILGNLPIADGCRQATQQINRMLSES